MKDIEQDPEFQALIRTADHPSLDLISALAKKKGIREVYQFWDLFDLVSKKWKEHKLR